MSSRAFYDAIADALTGFLPPALRNFEWYRTSHNLKLWYPPNTHEHYEVQHVRQGKTISLEVGFHAEYKERQRNETVLEGLVAKQKQWRKSLGAEPEAAPFIGYQSNTWRRISELWPDEGNDFDIAVDAAERLATYIKTFEPLRNGSSS